MQNQVFQKQAQDRLASPEQLDALMQVTKPRGWLALITIVLLLFSLGAWAFVTEILVTLDGNGVLRYQEDGLTAVLYLSAEELQEVRIGMDVQLAPVTVTPQKFGYLLGTVQRIESQPTSDPFADEILPNEAAYAVHLTLKKDGETPTGYAWSIGSGPDVTLHDGIALTGRIILRKERPINRVFPIFD